MSNFAEPEVKRPRCKRPVPEIQPEELKRRLDAGEDIQVLDVREPFEYQIANLGAK